MCPYSPTKDVLQSISVFMCYYCYITLLHYCVLTHVTTYRYVYFNYEDFLELSNDENLLRKILLLTMGNFYEGSFDHINVYYLINNTTLIPIQFES